MFYKTFDVYLNFVRIHHTQMFNRQEPAGVIVHELDVIAQYIVG